MTVNTKNKPPGEKKSDKIMLLVYAAIAVLALYLMAGLGTALDKSVKNDGSIDVNLVSDKFMTAISSPNSIIEALGEGGYAPKFLLLAFMIIGITALYQYSKIKKRSHRKGVEHGSAEWGNKKEMQSLKDNGSDRKFPYKEPQFKPLLKSDGTRVFDEKGEFAGFTIDNNIILTQEVFMSLNSRQHLMNLNVLIIGGSGSGKTRFYAKPNILQLNSSYVITDPKGEILQAVGKLLIEAGYELRVLNTIEMEHSNNYNPFHYVYDYDDNLSEENVTKMIDVFMQNTKGEGEKDDFWSQSATKLITALVFLLFEESEYNVEYDKDGKVKPETRDKSNLNFYSVTEKMRKLLYPPQGKEDGYFMTRGDESEEAFQQRREAAFLCPLDKDFIELERRKKDTLAVRLYKEVRNSPQETGQSILATAGARTQMFNLKKLGDLTCCDNIKLETLGDKKSALFIIISATNSTYNFLAAMMYTQMFDVLANRANFKHGGVLPVPVRCIMDEFANIGQIPDFDKVIAFVRSMGMSLNVIIQNLAQLKARYEKTWEVITGNCDSLLFLGGKETSTLKDISEALGKETIDVDSKNRTTTGGHKNDSTAESNSILGRELMIQDELQKMPISDCILMIRSHNPFYCKKFPLEKHPNFRFTEDFDKANAFDKSGIKVTTLEEFNAQNKNEVTKEAEEEMPQNETTKSKLEKVFPKHGDEIEVTSEPFEFDDYADIIMYSDKQSENIDEIVEDFATEEMIRFGRNSMLESCELGEPKPGYIKEVDRYDFTELTVEKTEDDDTGSGVNYSATYEDYDNFPELKSEDVAESVQAGQTETFAFAIGAGLHNQDYFAPTQSLM